MYTSRIIIFRYGYCKLNNDYILYDGEDIYYSDDKFGVKRSRAAKYRHLRKFLGNSVLLMWLGVLLFLGGGVVLVRTPTIY